MNNPATAHFFDSFKAAVRPFCPKSVEAWIGQIIVKKMHRVKQTVVRRFAERYRLKTLIETGTYMGDMVEAQKDFFDRIVSIELNSKLYQRARRRFRNDRHVELFHGDSGEILKKILKETTRPALFWLDAHYSGGITAQGTLNTPIWQELEEISAAGKGGVILIDDARTFNGCDDYPTIEELRAFVLKRFGDYNFRVEDDIIQVFPQ